ncbi:uncharacterized protein LOC110839977 [Zootermopsis nevadensis]|uniref:uncharacterized protein LOC110839977 n=1 Tax=Zootermopsis nevadensis TaxID=136037 RepID=UPI000B8E7A22|nr:uncharacterized protein LOC110839977 [Zootermopsis nevadensis]
MISSTTNYNVREQEPAAEDIQFHGMERFSALIICQMNYPVDQGSNPPDTVSTEGHSSETSYKRLKDYLKGMKQKVSTCIRTINSFGRFIMFLTIYLIVIIGTFGYNTNKVYWRKNNLSDSIVNTTFQDGTEERNLRNISIITHFWEIAETVMIDSIYGKSGNDAHQTFVLQDNKLIGLTRLRQICTFSFVT